MHLHQLLFGTLGANDVRSVGDEAAAHQTSLATGADETIVMPVTILERNETRAADASDRLDACCTAFGKQLAETFSAIWLLIATRETLSGQRHVAIGACEALPVPGFVLIGHTSRSDDLVAFNASSGEFLFITTGAIDFLFPRYEGLGTDDRLADATTEALFMPLPCLVFHLFGPGPENITATITA